MRKSDEYIKEADILKALSHPVRLCIVDQLIEQGGTTVSNLQRIMNIPQSTISQHILKLKLNGIIEGVRSGLEITYSVTNDLVKEIIKIIL